MTTVHLLHAGYAGDRRRLRPSCLVRDGDALIVVDPGMVAHRSLILDPLRDLGVAPEAVTHVFCRHHHLDHTINIALFPNAEVVDFWARYQRRPWLDHDGDGYPSVRTRSCGRPPATPTRAPRSSSRPTTASTRMTHLWWLADRTPEIDPLGDRPGGLDADRERILAAADIVIPGHGGPFGSAIER